MLGRLVWVSLLISSIVGCCVSVVLRLNLVNLCLCCCMVCCGSIFRFFSSVVVLVWLWVFIRLIIMFIFCCFSLCVVESMVKVLFMFGVVLRKIFSWCWFVFCVVCSRVLVWVLCEELVIVVFCW